jgi:putative ABC transport system ATP-binding protein
MASADINRGEPLIKARNLDKRYNRGGEEIHVLRGLSLDVKRGEFVAFMGPSGSGKTTLLNILGGLDQPSTGSVTVNGVDITTKSRKALAEWRARHVGLVFQAYNLIPVLTAAQNVELPLLLTSLDKPNRRKRIEAALRIVGLKDRMDHFPRQLSGGQEQRAAIARAIVSDPEMLLCDEPTGDLDRAAADNVLELLTLLATDRGTTVLMVTHDPRAADRAHRQLHLDKGVLVDAPDRATPEVRA